MRNSITIAIGLALVFGAGVDAAPTSMLHCLPKAEPAQAAPEVEKPSKMGWLTKWFRGPEKAPAPSGLPEAVPQGATVNGVPVAAYAPPQAATPTAPSPVSPSPVAPAMNDAWRGLASPAQATGLPSLPTLGTPASADPAVARATTAGDVKKLRELGHEKDRTGDLVAAERLYRQAIGVDPTSAAAVNDLALCLARQGRLDASVATLEQAIRMRPDKPLYRNNIATVLVELNRTEEALGHLKTAYGDAAAHHNLGQLFARSGKTGLAVQHLQTALQLEPSLGPAHQALARLAPTVPTIDQPMTQQAAAPMMAPRVAANAPVVTAPTPPPAPVATAPVQPAVPTFPRLLPPVLGQ